MHTTGRTARLVLAAMTLGALGWHGPAQSAPRPRPARGWSSVIVQWEGARAPWVKHVSPDLPGRKSDEYTASATGADVALARYGLSGAGVSVAVLDSGIQSGRADFGGRVAASVDFAGGTERPRRGRPSSAPSAGSRGRRAW